MRRAIGLVVLAVLLLAEKEGFGQRFTVGTNVVDILTLGTVNIEGGASVARKVTVLVGGELNPLSFSSDGSAFRSRQMSLWGGARYWPWHAYSGWWAGGTLRWTVYNNGGFSDPSTEEGFAYGAGIYAGYSVMLTDRWNIDIGAGGWGGWKTYTVYACPTCGRITGEGGKTFLLPDARVAVQYVF